MEGEVEEEEGGEEGERVRKEGSCWRVMNAIWAKVRKEPGGGMSCW